MLTLTKISPINICLKLFGGAKKCCSQNACNKWQKTKKRWKTFNWKKDFIITYMKLAAAIWIFVWTM